MYHQNPLERDASGGLVLGQLFPLDQVSVRGLDAARADIGAWVSTLNAKFKARQAANPTATLTAQERRQMAEVDDLKDQIKKAMAKRQAEDDEARGAPDPGAPNADAYYSQLAARRAGLDVGGHGSTIHRPRGRKFGELFPSATSWQGWKSSHQFMRTIALGHSDDRLEIQGATFQGGDSSGGYAIPGPILARWSDMALEDEIVRSRGISWPIPEGAREISVPSWAIGDRSDGSVGGLSIQWETEDPPADADLQIAKTQMVTLHPRRGAIYVECSNELLEDAPQFEQQLDMIMSRALSYGLDRAFLFTGDGASSPLAVINSPALISVARDTSGVIIWDDLASMFSRLSPASFRGAIWVTHVSCLPSLMKVSVPVGTAGSIAPQALNERAPGVYTLFGLPCLFTEKSQPLGTLGDLMLCDFSQYYIGLKSDMRIDKSVHLGFRRNKTTFRIQTRIDGSPVLSAPETPPNSADTVSPFIVLAA